MIEILEGKLLRQLKERQDKLSIELYKNLEIMCRVMEPFIDALPHQEESLTGINHIRGVIREIEDLTRGSPFLCFTSSEIFILLSAIATHDVGKLEEISLNMEGKEEEELNQIKEKRKEIFRVLEGKINLKLSNELKTYLVDGKKSCLHPLISAKLIAEEPSKAGIFDKELARMVSIVVASHLKNFREHLNIDSILGDKYLARHGKIRLSWLCALLAIGDDLDTSYHRAIPDYFSDYNLPSESSKGKFRRCIGGCKIDLTGRCIIIFPLKELEKAIYNCATSEAIYDYFAKDISEKNKLLKFWRHELKQMDIEIESCLVEVNGHLLKVIDDKNNRSNVNIGNVSKFILTVEPTITYFKINRVLDGMFNLRYGVFNKRYFSWEMLQSEAGFENQDELKLIVHRIARLATIYSDLESSELLFFEKEFTCLPYTIKVEELDGEWKIDVLSRDSQQQDSPTNRKDSILEIGSRLLFFIKSIIDVKPGLDDYRNTIKLALTKIELPSPSESPPLKVSFNNEEFNITRFFIRPGNQNLTYLLDEINLCPKLSPLGIELPKLSSMYIDTDKKNNIRYFPKILGINLVIAGPPGIGKSTLALDMITNLLLVGCTDCKGKKGEKSLRMMTNIGAVTYFSLEQPLFTIKRLANLINRQEYLEESIETNVDWVEGHSYSSKDAPKHDCLIGSPGFDFCAKILESSPLGVEEDTQESLEISSIRSREYLNFFEDNNKRRILLLPRLSPRFVGEITEKSERILFWQRFKQISRLLESSYSITKGDPFHPNRLHAVVIDNLNCFLNEPMAREYIFKIFRLMSLSGVLGIFILEDLKEETVDSIKVLEEVRFLTDIWIELGWKYKLDYKYKTIEIKKSRYQRHVVGSHPFKIRLEENVQ